MSLDTPDTDAATDFHAAATNVGAVSDGGWFTTPFAKRKLAYNRKRKLRLLGAAEDRLVRTLGDTETKLDHDLGVEEGALDHDLGVEEGALDHDLGVEEDVLLHKIGDEAYEIEENLVEGKDGEGHWKLKSGESMGEGSTRRLSYSVGMERLHGHPEVCVCGLPPRLAARLTKWAVLTIGSGCSLSGVVEARGIFAKPLPVYFREMPSQSLAAHCDARGVSAVQMFWPDEQGLYPWEDGCDQDFAEGQCAVFSFGREPPEMETPHI